MKKRQLDEAQAECASSAALTAWQTINWVSFEKEVRKLQVRIVESHQHFDNEGLQAKASSPCLHPEEKRQDLLQQGKPRTLRRRLHRHWRYDGGT